jgi:hypothetical protein
VGADVGYRCDERGTTSLYQAALNGHKDVLKALLDAGASVDDEDNQGATALHIASGEDIAMALTTAGADVAHEDRGNKTPGRRALERQATAVVEAIISGHANRSKIYYTKEDVKYSQVSISGDQRAKQAAPQQTSFRQSPQSPPASQQSSFRNLSTPQQTLPSSSLSSDRTSDPQATTRNPESKLFIVIVSMMYTRIIAAVPNVRTTEPWKQRAGLSTRCEVRHRRTSSRF